MLRGYKMKLEITLFVVCLSLVFFLRTQFLHTFCFVESLISLFDFLTVGIEAFNKLNTENLIVKRSICYSLHLLTSIQSRKVIYFFIYFIGTLRANFM